MPSTLHRNFIDMFVITHSAILKWLSFTIVGISLYVGYFWFEKNVQIRKILYVGVKIQINNFIFLILINFQGNDDWNDNPSTTFSNKKLGLGQFLRFLLLAELVQLQLNYLVLFKDKTARMVRYRRANHQLFVEKKGKEWEMIIARQL